MTKEEFVKNYYGTYKKEALYFLMKNFNLNYVVATNYLDNLFIDSKITLDQLHYMTNELKKREDLLSKEIATYESKLTPKKEVDKSKIANTIVEHWGYLSNKERMEFLLKFVKEIVIVNRDKDKVNGKPEILDVKFYEE